MEVRYTPGDGVLVARAGRWLLLGAGAPVRPGVLDQLWDDLGQPAARSLALATVRTHLAGTAVAWLDGASGDTFQEDGGVVERHGDRVDLTVADSPAAATLRLVEGVVAAAALQVTGAVPLPGDAAGTTGAVIDGIPPEILAAAGPTRPPAYDATQAAAAAEPTPAGSGNGTVRRQPPEGAAAVPADTDHDHRTRMRVPAAPMPASPGHLEQPTSDTVLAIRCGRGHLTDPLAEACRTCGDAVPRQEPQRVLRPQLGVLRLADGDLVPLDRPVVLGRRPTPTGMGDWPHLVTLPTDSTYLSRRHLRIDLDGWHVLAEDLASRGGTTIFAPGRDPEKIRPHEPYLLEHGTTVDLAGAYRLTYLVTVPPTAEAPA